MVENKRKVDAENNRALKKQKEDEAVGKKKVSDLRRKRVPIIAGINDASW